MLIDRVYIVSKRFFGIPIFFNYKISADLYKLLFPDKSRINNMAKKHPGSSYASSFGSENG